MNRSRRQPTSRRWPRLEVTTDGQGLVSPPGPGCWPSLPSAPASPPTCPRLAPIVKAPPPRPGEVLVDLAVMLADGYDFVLDFESL